MKHKLFLALLCFLITGCTDHRLLHNLSESNASRLVGRLQQDGIEAEKILQADGRWAVSVPNRVAGQSLRILTAERLLPDRVREAPQSAGMFASQEAQQLAYERAVSFQTEEMLLGIEGILDARVSLRLAEKSRSLRQRDSEGKIESASAAVLILSRDTTALEKHELELLVSRAAGVPLSAVHVVIRTLPMASTETQTELLREISPPSPGHGWYEECLVALGIAGLLLGVCLWRQKGSRSIRLQGKRELLERIV